MPRASIDLDELERGTRASQGPSVVPEAVITEAGQDEDGGGDNLEGSDSTTSHAAVEDDVAPEHDVGQVGLARLKSKDPQFNFYPIFGTERAMVLDSTVVEIHNLSRKMRQLRKRIKAKNGVEPRALGRGKRGRKRWEMMSKRMRDKLKELGIPPSTALLDILSLRPNNIDDGGLLADAGFVAWKAMDECARPQPGGLKMLHHWIENQPEQHWEMYNDQDVDLFRLLGPERGPIARFVHESVPAMALAEYVLRPFRARSSADEMFQYRAYLESTLERVATAVTLLLMIVFLLMPLAVLACFGANVTISVPLVLGMAVLVFFLAESMEKSEGRRFLLVFGYLAVTGMGMFAAHNS